MAPVVQTILDSSKEMHTSTTDVLACGSTLGNLFRVARGVGKPFRFCIEVIGNTVFFLRQVNDPKELIEDIRGYGHTFPEAYTTWDEGVKGSETSQRIVHYEFGGLRCMVRFECDGYLENSTAENAAKATTMAQANRVDDLVDALQDNTVFSKQALTNNLTVKKGGEAIAQSSIFDLKTRSLRYGKEIDMNDVYPLLWIKQIPNFVVAYHDGQGLFQDIRVQNIQEDMEVWQEDNKHAIGRFAALLNKLIEFSKDKRELLEVYCPGADVLEIRSQYGQDVHALPTELADRWSEESDEKNMRSNYPDRERYSSDGLEHRSDDADDSDGSDRDYTACSASDCGYCGKCTY